MSKNFVKAINTITGKTCFLDMETCFTEEYTGLTYITAFDRRGNIQCCMCLDRFDY